MGNNLRSHIRKKNAAKVRKSERTSARLRFRSLGVISGKKPPVCSAKEQRTFATPQENSPMTRTMTLTMTLTLTRVSLLSGLLMIPAIVTTDAAPRKASNTQQAETTGVATPDAPAAQTPARRARAAVQPAANDPPLGATNMANGVQSSIQVGDRCFRPTDGRGYGYWTSCDQVYTFVLSKGLKARDSEVQSQMDRGSDGGGGDGGGGSGGQR
jgi:hypothetical protein